MAITTQPSSVISAGALEGISVHNIDASTAEIGAGIINFAVIKAVVS